MLSPALLRRKHLAVYGVVLFLTGLFIGINLRTLTQVSLGLSGGFYTQVRAAPQTLCTCSKTAYVKGALYWIHSQNPALVSWPIRHVTYKNRSPLLAAYRPTATQNIVPQVEPEIKVSIKICVVRTLG